MPTRTAVAGVSSSTQDVEAFITTLLAEQLAVDRSEIDINRPIGSPPLGADGLDVIEIIMGIEEHFDVAIPDEDLERGREARRPSCRCASTRHNS